jgi:hypothetical protein
MTKSVTQQGAVVSFLAPRAVARDVVIDAGAIAELEARAGASVPVLTRAVVAYTIALQNRRALEHGNVQPIQLSVLNRRRRVARAWLLAILAGKVDAGTRHAVATQWLPTLCAAGPAPAQCTTRAVALIEYVRGAITACIFDQPADNLVPQARALHALEQALAAHLGAVRDLGRSPA